MLGLINRLSSRVEKNSPVEHDSHNDVEKHDAHYKIVRNKDHHHPRAVDCLSFARNSRPTVSCSNLPHAEKGFRKKTEVFL